MAKPAPRNLTVYRGDDYTHRIVFSNNGNPLPVDAYTFSAQIRAKAEKDSAEPLAEFDIDMADAADGIITLSLDAEDTQDISKGKGFWDLQVDPIKKTWLAGSVTFIGDVTRD